MLNQVLGILSQRRDVPLDDGLFLVGQQIIAQRNQVAEQVAAGSRVLHQADRAGGFDVLAGNVSSYRETTAEILHSSIGGALIIDLGDFPLGIFLGNERLLFRLVTAEKKIALLSLAIGNRYPFLE